MRAHRFFFLTLFAPVYVQGPSVAELAQDLLFEVFKGANVKLSAAPSKSTRRVTASNMARVAPTPVPASTASAAGHSAVVPAMSFSELVVPTSVTPTPRSASDDSSCSSNDSSSTKQSNSSQLSSTGSDCAPELPTLRSCLQTSHAHILGIGTANPECSFRLTDMLAHIEEEYARQPGFGPKDLERLRGFYTNSGMHTKRAVDDYTKRKVRTVAQQLAAFVCRLTMHAAHF